MELSGGKYMHVRHENDKRFVALCWSLWAAFFMLGIFGGYLLPHMWMILGSVVILLVAVPHPVVVRNQWWLGQKWGPVFAVSLWAMLIGMWLTALVIRVV